MRARLRRHLGARMSNHSWDKDREQRIAAAAGEGAVVSLAFADGNARNIRVCKHCGIKKFTVIPSDGWPWREWETPDGKHWRSERTPPCLEGKRGGLA
jgi:hypothetical protein